MRGSDFLRIMEEFEYEFNPTGDTVILASIPDSAGMSKFVNDGNNPSFYVQTYAPFELVSVSGQIYSRIFRDSIQASDSVFLIFEVPNDSSNISKSVSNGLQEYKDEFRNGVEGKLRRRVCLPYTAIADVSAIVVKTQ